MSKIINKPLKMTDIGVEDNSVKVVKPIVSEKIKQDNFLPIEDLPSKYKLYPEGTKILARPLKVDEVKLLASMDEGNYNFVMNDILKRTVKGIDVNDILVDDKHFIIFWLRANTYKNSGYEVDFYCKKCDKNSKYNFNVDVLDVVYLRDDFKIDNEIVLTLSKENISIKFKTIGDENKVLEFVKRSKNSLAKYDDELLGLSSSIDKVNGNGELSLVQKYQYLVETMHPEDFSYFVSYVKAFSFGVKSEINAVCNICKEGTPIGVTFRPEFFIPEYKF